MVNNDMTMAFNSHLGMTARHGIFLFLLAFLFLAGCSSNPNKPIYVVGDIQATTILNPDINGSYRPVNIKIYYLKTDTAFTKAGFADLYKHTDKVLGDSILHLSSYQVLPGQSLELQEEVPAGVNFIGVVAAFRDIRDATWKDIKPIPEKCMMCTGPGLWDPVKISVDRLSITLDLGDD